jgi:hypothetical protein
VDRLVGTSTGTHLEPVAGQHESGKHGGRLEKTSPPPVNVTYTL